MVTPKQPKLLTCRLRIICLFLLLSQALSSQNQPQSNLDQLLQKLETARPDTNKANLLNQICRIYSQHKDTANTILYTYQQLELSQQLNWPKGQARAYIYLGNSYFDSDGTRALKYYQQAYELAEKYYLTLLQYRAVTNTAYVYQNQKKYDQAISVLKKAFLHFLPAKELDETYHVTLPLSISSQLNISYLRDVKDTVEAVNCLKWVFDRFEEVNDTLSMRSAMHSLYGEYFYFLRDYNKALQYALGGLNYFSKNDTSNARAFVLAEIAEIMSTQGRYVEALEYYRKAINLKPGGDLAVKTVANSGLRSIYFLLKDYTKALMYDLEELNFSSILQYDDSQISGVYYKLSIDCSFMQQYNQSLAYVDKALDYVDKAIKKTGRKGYLYMKGSLLMQKTTVYTLTQQYDNAMRTVRQSVAAIQGIDTSDQTPAFLTGQIIRDAPDEVLLKYGIPLAERNQQAIRYLQIALNEKIKAKTAYPELYRELSMAYKKAGRYQEAYDYYEHYIFVRDTGLHREAENAFLNKVSELQFERREDSLRYQQQLTEEKLHQQTLLSVQQRQTLLLNQQKMALLGKEKDLQELNYLKTQSDLEAEQNRRKTNEKQLSLSQKEQALAQTTVRLQRAEIRGRQAQSRYMLMGITALLALSFFIGRNYYNQRKANKQINTEKQRSDNLLLNILPADVAEELKEKGSAGARQFEDVTVLFTDFVNFTAISELLTPQELVDELHYCFKAFDEIIGKYGIEKIKTIGDAYLAVAGLPNADAQHAANTVNAALEIRQFIHDRKLRMANRSFDIRIGIHSGSVVAGIVGVKKFAYDIWGDTVNTAARMEQHSQPGQINLSEKTYELVKDQFTFTYRGEIEAKNKGALKMYFVEKQATAIELV